MLQANNQLLEHSIVSMYVMENIWYFVFAGLLSYNLPLVFKLKQESGYLIRAGIMVLMSMAIVPIAMLLPTDFKMGSKLLVWGACFVGGIVFASYGARILKARFSLLLSRFTVKSSVRRGSKTDIRYMDKELPVIAEYNPLKYINLKKGVFVGLDESVKPIYLKDPDDWYKRHFLIVGASRSGKGVAMQSLGIQSLMLGETIVFLDPKGDKYLPHIFKSQCDELGVNYSYIDLTQDMGQINLIADFTARDLKNCLVEAFSLREMGSESDVYRKNEQEFLENFAAFACEQNNSSNFVTTGDKIRTGKLSKSLASICQDYEIDRYADKFKSSVSDLNKLIKVVTINAASGKSLAQLLNGGGCVYIVGDLLDETIKKIQRFIFCRIVQLARGYANEVNSKEKNITVFADELVAHISRFVAESYTVSLGWNLKIVSAVQDLKLLRGAPADLDPEFLKGAVFGNSQNKLFYRADDIDTADFLSDMTGRIQIEEEQKLVTRNSLNSEQLDRQTRLIQSERNYFDRNMILNLKQFEAVFCASLPYRKTIASLCKTSPIKVNGNVSGKILLSVDNLVQRQSAKSMLDNINPQSDNQNNNIQHDTENLKWQQIRENNLIGTIKNEHSSNNNDSTGNNPQETSSGKSNYLF
ncbi:MAG TPA: type IV secretory system conjugative DNA transfer family protein [Burkholderiales bacterium]|nr:type IV secretory system conjugative DNA transfer family protein [Burkholderiales bacterium]